MNEKGKAFVDRMALVKRMMAAGTPTFAALAAGLEDDDWILVYAAAQRMAYEIVHQSPQDTTGTGESS
jgi:hypothetical protein